MPTTFVTAGQSNSAGGFLNSQPWSHASLTPRMWKVGAVGWATLADPTGPGSGGSAWPRLATQFMAARNQSVDFICTGVGSTFLDPNGDWNPSTGDQYADCVNTIIASGVTSIDALLWDQGEGETHNASTATLASYNAALKAMHDQMQIDTGLTFPMIVAQTGTVPADVGSTTARIDMIRNAQWQAVASEADIYPGPIGYDRTGIHWETNVEAQTLGARWWLAIEAALYGGTNRGPYPISAIETAGRTAIRVRLSKPLLPGQSLPTIVVKENGTPISFGFGYSGSTITLTPLSTLTGTVTIDWLTGNEDAGYIAIYGESITLPNGATTRLPLEPVYGLTTTAAEAVSTAAVRVPNKLRFLA